MIVLFFTSVIESHPTWVRGLKLISFFNRTNLIESHPTWVRGLKPFLRASVQTNHQSHPTWVRGLKHHAVFNDVYDTSRTLRGCVD